MSHRPAELVNGHLRLARSSRGVTAPPNLTDSEYDAGHALQSLGTKASVTMDDSLHLSVSMRSFRAEHVSRFVKAVLDFDTTSARDLLSSIGPRYPIALTRDLNTAKDWI